MYVYIYIYIIHMHINAELYSLTLEYHAIFIVYYTTTLCHTTVVYDMLPFCRPDACGTNIKAKPVQGGFL